MYHKHDKRFINNTQITTYKKEGSNCLYIKKKDKQTGKFNYIKLNKKKSDGTRSKSLKTAQEGGGLLEKYFKNHNFPFQSNSIDVNMFGHPSVKTIKHDPNLLYTTFNDGKKSKNVST